MRWSSCSLLLLLLTACPADDASPGNTDDPSSAGTVSSSDGSATSVGATSMGTTMGATSVGASSSGDGESSDTAPMCPGFADEPSPGTITIEITNTHDDGIWVPLLTDCILSVPYTVTGPGGEPVQWRAPDCGTCEGAVQGQCPCPPPFCDELTGLFIEGGATAEYTWSGLAYVDEDVPPACPGIDDCGATCQRAVVPDAGGYTFAIQAGRASGCATEPCACTPMDGSCTLYDPGMMFGMLSDFSGTVDLPGGALVQITID